MRLGDGDVRRDKGHPHGHGHVPSAHGPMGLRVRRTGCGRWIEKQADRREPIEGGRGLPEAPCIRLLHATCHGLTPDVHARATHA